MSAESNIVRPASRQTSTRRVASATSLAPHALKNLVPPPKVPVPKLRAGTFSPEPPSCRYSIAALLMSLLVHTPRCSVRSHRLLYLCPGAPAKHDCGQHL